MAIQEIEDTINIGKKDKLRLREQKQEALTLIKDLLASLSKAMLTGAREDFLKVYAALRKFQRCSYMKKIAKDNYRFYNYFTMLYYELTAVETYIQCFELDS